MNAVNLPETKLEALSKSRLITVCAAAATVVLIALIVGVAGKGLNPVVISRTAAAWQCVENGRKLTAAETTQYDTKTCSGLVLSKGMVWNGLMVDLSSYHQYVFLTGRIRSFDYGKSDIKMNIPIRTYIWGRDHDHESWTTIADHTTKNSDMFRYVECDKNKIYCDAISFIDIPFITYNQYNVTIQFLSPTAPTNLDWMADMEFEMLVMNPTLTKFELGFKTFFLIGSLVALGLYAWTFSKIPQRLRSYDQKYIFLHLIFLIGFNDPFIAVNILKPNFTTALFTTILSTFFVCWLLLYWLVTWHKILKSTGMENARVKLSSKRFYAPKIALVGVFWIAVVAVYTYHRLELKRDPTWALSRDSQKFFLVLGSVVLAFILFWLLILAVLSVKEIRSMTRRHQAMFSVSFVVAICAVIGFVAGVFGPVPFNSAEFVAFYTLLNVYVILIGYLHLPCQHTALLGPQKLSEEPWLEADVKGTEVDDHF